MTHAIRRLPDSELEVMQAVWACTPPVSRADIEAKLAELQQQAYAAFEEMKANPDAAADISMKTAKAVHAAVVELVNAIK